MNHNHTFAICAYKESPYIQECIDSLKNQNVPSEIILCTSTPNDFLTNIARTNKLKLCVNSKNQGIAADWNFALRQSNTDYVTLAHQDDIYFPNYTSNILDAAKNHTDFMIIHSNYQEIVHGNNQVFIRKYSLNFMIKIILNMCNTLRFGSAIGCPTVTYNLKNLKDFQFSDTFSINMDWYAWYQMSKMNGSLIWINKTLMSHRIHAESETSKGLAKNQRQKEDFIMFKKYWPNQIALKLSQLYTQSYKNNA